MKQVLAYTLAFVTFLSVGCQSSEKQNDNRFTEASEPAVRETNERQEQQDKLDREMTDEEIREYGRVLAIEDGVYPMFIVTIEFPEKGTTQDFDLNIQSVEISDEELQALNGRYITCYYTSDLENDLFRMTCDNEVIVHGKDVDPSWEKVTGILEGAEEETMSDLPGSVTVRTAAGDVFDFPYYITPEMVEANGKEVRATYGTREVQNLTYLRVSEE